MNNYKKPTGKNYYIFKPDEEYDSSHEHLPPGIYRSWIGGSMMTGYYPVFEPLSQGDKLVKFTTGVVSTVLGETEKFFSEGTRNVYRELKITHKIGLLFHGKQGTGKTSTCMLIMKGLVEKYEAICIDFTGKPLDYIRDTLNKIRRFQKSPIVAFVDEFDSSLRSDEEGYLTFLDGTDSVDGLIFIGCTNYVDKIPDRLKRRKSRIKHIYNIDSLPLEIYKEYLSDRVPSMPQEEISKFAYLASEKGLTIDQLKHALIDYKIENVPIDKAVQMAATFENLNWKKL